MDNHPIPQDVTNFQFHLIGDMTLKQFGYILGGVILGWTLLASPLFFIIKLFLAGVCVLGSVTLAFVPIEGRSSDVMLMHFIKALFSPTQFIYQKISANQQAASMTTTSTTPTPLQETRKSEKTEKSTEKVQVESFTPVATAAVQARLVETPRVEKSDIQQQDKPSPQAPQPQQEVVLQKEAQILSQELEVAKQQEKTTADATASAKTHEKVTDLEQELQDVLKQKQELERQLVDLEKTLNTKKQQVFSPTTMQETPQITPRVKKVPKQMGASVGTPFVPDVPNLITGVIKDPRGNVLGNILIEVKDKDNNPVRAFKTNQLGQFAAATPLVNGAYTISFEDPAGKQSFDSIELVTNGTILLPLEIFSVDAREKLRQELFGIPA